MDIKARFYDFDLAYSATRQVCSVISSEVGPVYRLALDMLREMGGNPPVYELLVQGLAVLLKERLAAKGKEHIE